MQLKESVKNQVGGERKICHLLTCQISLVYIQYSPLVALNKRVNIDSVKRPGVNRTFS